MQNSQEWDQTAAWQDPNCPILHSILLITLRAKLRSVLWSPLSVCLFVCLFVGPPYYSQRAVNLRRLWAVFLILFIYLFAQKTTAVSRRIYWRRASVQDGQAFTNAWWRHCSEMVFRDNYVIFRRRSKRIAFFGISEFFYVCLYANFPFSWWSRDHFSASFGGLYLPNAYGHTLQTSKRHTFQSLGYQLGTCEASIFDSNSNRTCLFEFDSKVTCRFENFESARHFE